MNDQPVVGVAGKSGDGSPTTAGSLTRLPLADIVQPDSPRLSGLNDEHARLLAHSEATLPPILVNRRTMRVVDGAHRLLAAKLRGQETIDVHFCDCDNDEAFVLAVEKNVTHGLPLSRAERTGRPNASWTPTPSGPTGRSPRWRGSRTRRWARSADAR